MGLKAFISGGNAKPHAVEIDGVGTLNFYKVSVAAMLRAQSVVSTLARSAMGFFDPNAKQYTEKLATSEQDPKTGAIIGGSVEKAISPLNAAARIDRRASAVEKAVEALMSEDNMTKLAILVCDSLRDEKELEPKDLLDYDVELFLRLVKETVVANAPTLAPLVDEAMGSLKNALSPADEPDEQEETTE